MDRLPEVLFLATRILQDFILQEAPGVFQKLWQQIGQNIGQYRSYPRIVGETGGKDFVMVHASADAKQVATALSRGAFEFQGKMQCRLQGLYTRFLVEKVEKHLTDDLKSFKMGSPEDFGNFINAVIDERAYDKITSYIENAKKDKKKVKVIGRKAQQEKGLFIEPTVILAEEPGYVTMCEELFGPVLTIYVYKDDQ